MVANPEEKIFDGSPRVFARVGKMSGGIFVHDLVK
jgi:hypothetical protein